MDTELGKELGTAVADGDEGAVLAALARGADINTTVSVDHNQKSICLLSEAAKRGHHHLLPHLLKAGLPVEGSAQSPSTPLYWAARYGHVEVINQLMLHASPNLEARTYVGNTPLLAAAQCGHESCVKVLLKAGADPNNRDDRGQTPLHRAALKNAVKVMKQLLLDKRCNLHAVCNQDNTALHLAADGGALEASTLLVLEGVDPTYKDNLGLTAVDRAKGSGYHILAWWLSKLPCHQSLEETPARKLTELVWKAFDVEYGDMLQWIRNEQLPYLTLNIPSVRDGHQQDAAGMTPLHWAAQLGVVGVVQELLVECKLYPRVFTFDGDTPADLALRAGHRQVQQVLYLHHPPETQQGTSEQLYEQLLCLISKGDDVKKACDLLHCGAPLEPVGHWSVQAVSLAITNNRPRTVSLLLAAGAPLITTTSGLSLLTLAWRSPDVTPIVQVTITRMFLHVLEYERGRLPPPLAEGVDHLIAALRSETPWQATWPPKTPVATLTDLMAQAAHANCALTCSFLRQAGAQPSLSGKSGLSPLHAAMESEHWVLVQHMVKYMGASLFVPDTRGLLHTRKMCSRLHHQLDQNVYNLERNKLQDLKEKMKDNVDKEQVQGILDLQEDLFTTYSNKMTGVKRKRHVTVTKRPEMPAIGKYAFLVASQGGLQQLLYLLVKEAGLPVDIVVDPVSGTTPLHQSASHGRSGCVILLVSLGAQPLLPDRYGHTSPHLAAMFHHPQTYEILKKYLTKPQPKCRAETTPQQVSINFSKYVKFYKYLQMSATEKKENVFSEQNDALKHILSFIDVRKLVKDLNTVVVDYSKGEAREVKEVVVAEMKTILRKVAALDQTFRGKLELLGSSADGTRLYCPDEFDFNIVLQGFSTDSVDVEVTEQSKEEASLSGHKLRVEVKTKHPALQGNVLILKLYYRVKQCLAEHTLTDKRLSIVPPGLTKTQVGVSLSLAWQGSEFPLLLIGIDLVPVLLVDWPDNISRPFLTPTTARMMYISNTADKSWRCSFAATEVELLMHLNPQERQVFLTAKTLLSCMKAEPWMPRDLKDLFCWWDSRYWKVPVPAGFCLKNSFLRQLEKKRKQNDKWQKRDVTRQVKEVFRGMCQDYVNPSSGVEILVPAKVDAYFGGECERPKVGESAPEITAFLDKRLKKIR